MLELQMYVKSYTRSVIPLNEQNHILNSLVKTKYQNCFIYSHLFKVFIFKNSKGYHFFFFEVTPRNSLEKTKYQNLFLLSRNVNLKFSIWKFKTGRISLFLKKRHNCNCIQRAELYKQQFGGNKISNHFHYGDTNVC